MSVLMFGFWVLDEIWIIGFSSAAFVGMYVCVCILGAFQDQYKQTMMNKYSSKHNYVKNPNWLFASAAEKLNSGLPRTTSTSGQNGI